MTTPSSSHKDTSPEGLEAFIEGVCESDPFKVEKDFGYGYVRLRSTEAEKRQAAQDIKCVEDIVIELLRNSRDAHAKNIYLATTREGEKRFLTVIDDGCGIPQEMWNLVFEPRVTSKLETAHMDKWGMHGRGMALYSTKVNTDRAEVVASEADQGCSIRIEASASLPEKADQSTFPRFEEAGGVMAMRGPKNILRTCCEFALEHRHEVTVRIGSPAQVAAALYQYGLATIPAYARAFGTGEDIPLTRSLGLAHSPEDLAERAERIGLPISLRTARRIMDGEGSDIEDLATLMARSSFTNSTHGKGQRPSKQQPRQPVRAPRISSAEKDAFLAHVMDAYADIAEAYYLDSDITPAFHVRDGKIVIEIPLAANEADEEDPGL